MSDTLSIISIVGVIILGCERIFAHIHHCRSKCCGCEIEDKNFSPTNKVNGNRPEIISSQNGEVLDKA